MFTRSFIGGQGQHKCLDIDSLGNKGALQGCHTAQTRDAIKTDKRNRDYSVPLVQYLMINELTNKNYPFLVQRMCKECGNNGR